MTEQSFGWARRLGAGYREFRSDRQRGPLITLRSPVLLILTVIVRLAVLADGVILPVKFAPAPHLSQIVQPRSLVFRVDDQVPTITLGRRVGDSFRSTHKHTGWR